VSLVIVSYPEKDYPPERSHVRFETSSLLEIQYNETQFVKYPKRFWVETAGSHNWPITGLAMLRSAATSWKHLDIFSLISRSLLLHFIASSLA
jgi:hypothetical protein